MKRVLLTLVLLFVVSTVAVAGDYYDGTEAYLAKDYATALKKFKKAATTSTPSLNEFLEAARPVVIPGFSDEALTEYWTNEYGQAHEDTASAQFFLGVMYDKGMGVPQDSQQAVRWYTKAAEAGDASAQFHLGQIFDLGRGVAQDYQQAVRWYTKAAEAGNAVAQYNLASMYYSGKGVPQDYVLAHMWANLAASQGGEDAVKKRDAIATLLTPNQIAAAQKLAREWKPTTLPLFSLTRR